VISPAGQSRIVHALSLPIAKQMLFCRTATDRMMLLSITGPNSQDVCPKRTVQKSADSTTIDSGCTFQGKPAAHAIVTVPSTAPIR
jgi:hypothetical protein